MRRLSSDALRCTDQSREIPMAKHISRPSAAQTPRRARFGISIRVSALLAAAAAIAAFTAAIVISNGIGGTDRAVSHQVTADDGVISGN
jgi:hypothetical protein